MIPVLGVPVLARPDLLHRMIQSIDADVEHLVIIDNGGVVGPVPHLGNIANVHVVSLPSNLGVPASWNLIVKAMPHAPWWLISNFDVVYPEGALAAMAAAARRDAVVLSGASPPWASFILGDEVVRHIGLFDEGIYPCYWEDVDYQARCEAQGVDVVATGIRVRHDNSSTLAAVPNRNGDTFPANAAYIAAKRFRHDLSEGNWSLARRRELAWDA